MGYVGGGIILLIIITLLSIVTFVFWPDECTRPNPVPEEYDLSNVSEENLSIDNFSITGISCATGFTGTASAVVCDSDGSSYTLTGCSPGDATTGGAANANANANAVDGTNSPQAACAGITCNGANRTKKSASEINAIPPTTDPDEYPDTTFRSPCCKWHDLPDPNEGTKNGINYTDFLNTISVCPLDELNTGFTTPINAGEFVVSDNGRKCGGFTINANAGPNTPNHLLHSDKFPIKFIHDNPHRTGTFSCPTKCVCPQKSSGEYWGISTTDNWASSYAEDSFIKCHDQ